MAHGIHLVFSEPPEGVRQPEFDSWYQRHIGEVVAVPGFLSGQRYRIDPQIVDPGGALYRHLAVYEFGTDPDAALVELARADLGAFMPDWLTLDRFASWHCVPIGERVDRSNSSRKGGQGQAD